MARRLNKASIDTAAELESVEIKAALLDALPECVFLVDGNHRVVAVNKSVETMMGRDGTAVIGQSLETTMAPLIDGEGEPLDVGTPVDRCLATGEAELLEAWLRPGYKNAVTQDADLNKISVKVLPISETGTGDRVAIVVAGDAVSQPYRLRDAVLSMVSHELRTPLLHIKGFVSTLLESDIEWDEETRLDFLRTIDREADRLTSMVNDLMEITRMGSVDLPLHLEEADPYQLAYAAIDSASPFIRKHRVLVEIPENLPKIKMDVLRVMGVLANLLQNSSKYSEPGSRIVIGGEPDATAMTFSVTDEGAGIPSNARDKLFSMFYRGSNVGTTSSGSGLGLAVCKSVVDAHGGKIWFESEVDKGSTFKFTIPYKPEKIVLSEKVRPAPDKQLRPAKKAPRSTKTASMKRRKELSVNAKPKRKRKVALSR